MINALIKLAHDVPALRAHLVPIIRKQSAMDLIAIKVKKFKQMLDMPGEFGVLTAYGPGSKSQNKDRQTELVKDLNKLGYKFETMKGKWDGITENSLMVPNIKAKDLFDLGRKYEQISVIHKNKSGVVGMYYPKEGTVEVAVKPDASIAAEISKGNKDWSKSRGNSFTFGFLWGQKLPWDGKSTVSQDQVKKWVANGDLDPKKSDGSDAKPEDAEAKPDDPKESPEDARSHRDSKWWRGLTPEAKRKHCDLHPGSDYC
jgi:hypothetical protein